MTTAATESQEPVKGSDEYNQAMAAKGRGEGDKSADDDAQINELPITAMPENGHEKFYNKETGAYDWANHSKELQYRLDQAKGIAPAEAEGEAPDQGTPANEAEVVAYTRLMEDMTNGGEITDETWQAFKATGLSDTMVDRVIEDTAYRVGVQQQTAIDHAGGRDAMGELLQWAEKNLSQSEKDYYNAGLAGPAFLDAIDGMKAKMAGTNLGAREGQLQSGGNQIGDTVIGYKSKAERTADIQNPKYKKDPSFRRMVAEKSQRATYEDDRAEAYY